MTMFSSDWCFCIAKVLAVNKMLLTRHLKGTCLFFKIFKASGEDLMVYCHGYSLLETWLCKYFITKTNVKGEKIALVHPF